MKELQKDMMCALLRTLVDKELITHEIYEKSRVKICGTFDMPEAFRYAKDDRKEESHGSA